MGAGASTSAELQHLTIQSELAKPADASDVDTPRHQTVLGEVTRLRSLLHQNCAFEDPELGVTHRLALPTGEVEGEGKDAAAAPGRGDTHPSPWGADKRVEGDEHTSKPCWERIMDDANSTVYFYNWATGESTWETPEGGTVMSDAEVAAAEAAGEGGCRFLAGGGLTAGEANGPKKKHLWAVLRSAASMTQWDAPWAQFTDPRSGSIFWYHMVTGVSAWEKPSKEEQAAADLEAANSTESAWQCVRYRRGASADGPVSLCDDAWCLCVYIECPPAPRCVSRRIASPRLPFSLSLTQTHTYTLLSVPPLYFPYNTYNTLDTHTHTNKHRS